MKTGILGGGLAGLSLGLSLSGDFEILEAERECGGLCRSVSEQGFTFDASGGHALRSGDAALLGRMTALLGGNTGLRRGNPRCHYRGRYVKHPFEGGLSGLSLPDNLGCLLGYFFNRNKGSENLRERLLSGFGRPVASKYLLPYSEKYWKTPAEELAADACPAVPDASGILRSSLGFAPGGHARRLHYSYPVSGGIQALARAMEQRLDGRITTGFRISGIRKTADGWEVSDGNTPRTYSRLVCAMPLPDLISCLENVPDGVKAAAGRLDRLALITVMLGYGAQRAHGFGSIRFPDSDIIFHRICFPKNFSPECAPPDRFSVLAEITARPGDAIWKSPDEDIARQAVNDLHRKKFLDKRNVSYRKVARTRSALAVKGAGRAGDLKTARDYAASLGIRLCGSSAEFENLNMDDCYDRAERLGRSLEN